MPAEISLPHLDFPWVGLHWNYFRSWCSGSWDYCVHLENVLNIRVKTTKQCNQAFKVTTSPISLTATSYQMSTMFQALYLHISNSHSNLPGHVTSLSPHLIGEETEEWLVQGHADGKRQSRGQAQLVLTLTENIRQYTWATTVNKIQTGILIQWRSETNETVMCAIIRVSRGNPQSRSEGPEDTSWRHQLSWKLKVEK